MGYIYILGTILFTVYGQLILKWRISSFGALPDAPKEKVMFLFGLLFDPYILSGLISAFVASFFWMAAMTKFDISYAYPFMSFSFVLVFIFSVFLFKEPVSSYKLVGLGFIVIGIFITSKSV
ncbi:EamA-like transporter family protein [Paenibacillus sp. 1_12]|uniref:EamA family transporter n=1 Tax=Paenibacillus sp. 1_12 TaxID=1566278 RepID=UPI0008EC8C55|nr:EamA family transporter [Paenibacillus sp. 1_12]SFM13071.1 EamA-like transporter family protein [Paenibacillus sp. 1_12]